jgi:DnaJ-domain-containing protein 1
MKLNSKYFDRIRLRPDEEELLRDKVPTCDWPGCTALGRHPAPKGRDREGEYYHFCLEHVKKYNKNYNYFAGMADEELKEWLERNVTGHRPTWRMGANSWAFRPGSRRAPRGGGFRHNRPWDDRFGIFGEETGQSARPRRTLPPLQRDALSRLGLDESADRQTIKARYKELVKRYHPDTNGGSKEAEEILRDIIAAYQILRKSGLC